MASSVEIPTYRHESLPDPRTYIRLLQVCSIDEARDVPVHCQLTAWGVDAAPEYTAISYTWGDPNLLEFILVGGKKMEVRQNCGYVLRQAWRLKESGYIWIDAICINQTDSDEKSPQVAMMGSVYRKAVQTLACVGRHENDSQFLYKILHKKSHWWNKRALDPLFLRFRRAHLWALLLRNSTKARILKVFKSFVGRQYFRRVWIYQELFFGRDIRVCCDDESAHISMFYQVYIALSEWIFRPRIMLRCPSTDREQWYKQTFHTTEILAAAVSTLDTASLRIMMILVSDMQCEDPRDRFYGTRAVVDWGGMQPIEPDYNRDIFELGLEILQRLDRSAKFGDWIWDIQRTAETLHMIEGPPEKLKDAIQERLSLSSSNSITTNPRTPDEGHRQELMRFWGLRLLFSNATWEISRNSGTPSADRSDLQRKKASYTSQGIFPKIKEWSNGNPLDSAQADIVLSQGAKSQDWLLVPHSDEPAGASTDGYMPAFLARESGENLFHLVGKALVFRERLWPKHSAWELFWEKGISSAKYGVHIDPADGLLLSHSLNWNWYWRTPMTDAESRWKLAEKYFETKLCGINSCSYAVPVDV